jgi:hypothetical protein
VEEEGLIRAIISGTPVDFGLRKPRGYHHIFLGEFGEFLKKIAGEKLEKIQTKCKCKNA